MRSKFSDEKKTRRHDRVVELLKRELTSIFSREVKDHRLGHFTITELILSPDLRSAKIYVCKFMTGDGQTEPTKLDQENLIKGLSSASHFIYERLKKRLVMKQIPTIHFEYDYRLSEVSNVWNLVKKANEESSESEDEDGGDNLKGALNGSC